MNLYVTDPSTIPAPPPSTDEDLVPEVDEIEIDVVSEVDRTDQMAAISIEGLDYDLSLDEYDR